MTRLLLVGGVAVAGALAIAGCRKEAAAVPSPAAPRAIPRAKAAVAARSFMMPIEDVFSITGRGTVVTGRIERGVVKAGDEVEVVGLRPTTKTVVVGVEMFRKLLDEGRPDDNVGLVLRDVNSENIARGQVLAKPGSIAAHKKLEATVHVLAKEEGGRQTPFFAGYRPQFFFRTVDVTGVVALPPGTKAVNPGDDVSLRIDLVAPIACEHGTRFAIREGGKTVGAGTITAILD